MSKPRFSVEESWDNTGDVTVYFHEATTQGLRDLVARELRYFVPQLNKEQRSIYHLEVIMDRIFTKMNDSGNLKFNNSRWGWAEEV